ncbi:hypothetical protein H4R19_005754, partial [Coemansia spiralis]
MKLTLFSAAVVVALSACVSDVAAADWTADSTYECAIQNWPAVLQVVNPRIQAAWTAMPPPIKQMALAAGIMTPSNGLIANPSKVQVQAIANVFPSGMFHPFADNIVDKCLATY